jgi:SAM-dependent methyltransferase
MKHVSDTEIRAAVRERYTDTVTAAAGSCCGGAGQSGATMYQPGNRNADGTSCCSGGYDPAQLGTIPAGADLGLGCGNPTVAAAPRPGETVLDLGSGAGVDCFLAADKVGAEGRVIGVDMTPAMVDRARENARTGGYTNVEFRLGEIEALPVSDASVDLIISNCVINLSPEKERVFAEALRVLAPGGRLVVSDIVTDREVTETERTDMDLYCTCVSGAETVSVVHQLLVDAGFVDVSIERASVPFDWGKSKGSSLTVYSATISGRKPPA